VRLWVVAATPLATAKAPRLAAAPPPAQAPRAALDQPGQRRWFAGEAEAPHAATLCRRELATHGLDGPPRSDAERWRASKGQPAAARRCMWAKHPAVLAPSFVETPTRMAAVGGGDVSALLGSTRVERHVRNAPAARGETLPERPAPHPRPPARPMAVVTRLWAGPRRRPMTTLHAPQHHVIGLLGSGEALSTVPHRNSG
jgi:hypothetical protein